MFRHISLSMRSQAAVMAGQISPAPAAAAAEELIWPAGSGSPFVSSGDSLRLPLCCRSASQDWGEAVPGS